MTLSRFLRDYLYVPLGGNRKGPVRRYVNLLVTMLLGGLWHGAGWTFVIWGALHGFYLVINHAWMALRPSLPFRRGLPGGRMFATLLTFLAVVIGWVFFRAVSFGDATAILAGMAGANGAAIPQGLVGALGGVGVALQGLGIGTFLGGGPAVRRDVCMGGCRYRNRIPGAEHPADRGAVRTGARRRSRDCTCPQIAHLAPDVRLGVGHRRARHREFPVVEPSHRIPVLPILMKSPGEAVPMDCKIEDREFGAYLRRMLGVLFLGLLLTALFNWWVNPYRLFNPPQSSLTTVKARPDANIPSIKLLNAIDRHPDVVILGNSRADVGLDPANPSLQAMGNSVYNLAVPGQGMLGVLEQFRAIASNGDVKVALVGVDFIDFVVNAQPVSAMKPASDPRIDRTRWLETSHALLTLAGTQASLRTLRGANDAFAATLNSNGFNPMKDYELVALRSGYRAMFAQRYNETAERLGRARLGLYPSGATDSAEFAALREVFRIAAEHRIRLIVFTYPYHADYLMLFQQVGIWDDFREWKRNLTAIASSSHATHPDEPAPTVWDFAAFSEYSQQAVPTAGADGAAAWYWEGGHFKKQLGDVMLDSLLGAHDANATGMGIGRALTAGTIDSWLLEQDRLAELHAARAMAQPGNFLCCNRASHNE